MAELQPADFSGTTLVIAPHMDDETIGCGAMLAARADKSALHVVFATDGAHSPARPQQSPDEVSAIIEIRRQEALAALAVLGVPAANAAFLDFEDGTLQRCREDLRRTLLEHVARLQPRWILVPFRYDRHPDHLAVGDVVRAVHSQGALQARIAEYFVYSQWRLLRQGDVRRYVDPQLLRRVEPGRSQVKRLALQCHRSQTTRYYDWQTRPILTEELVERVTSQPELYLLFDGTRPGAKVLTRGRRWVPVAHRLEPALKRWKDRLGGWQGS